VAYESQIDGPRRKNTTRSKRVGRLPLPQRPRPDQPTRGVHPPVALFRVDLNAQLRKGWTLCVDDELSAARAADGQRPEHRSPSCVTDLAPASPVLCVMTPGLEATVT